MDAKTDYRLEDYVLGLEWDSLPAPVRERARGCALDLAGALCLGSLGRQFQVGLSLARGVFAPGDVGVLGSSETFSLVGATVAMGHSANSFDIDDGHNLIKGHPGASFAAGLLAASLKAGATYGDFLCALVAGYDVAVRSGLAIQRHYGFLHSTGTYGAVATAAVMGRMLGLDREQLNRAISIADFHAPLTPVMRSVEIPSMSKDGVPMGALVGAMAVAETLAGETGRVHTLELGDQRALLDDLGSDYEIMNLYFKPYTCCRWAHQPIRAVLDLMGREGLAADDVAHVTVHTFDSAARLSKAAPRDTDEAQYNIAWPVAAAVAHGDVGYAQVCDAACDDEATLGVLGRLDFVVDPELDAQFPERRLAWVEMRLADGRTLRSNVFAAEGEATDGITNEWLAGKFRRVTAPALLAADQEAVIDALLAGDLDAPMASLVSGINRALARSESSKRSD